VPSSITSTTATIVNTRPVRAKSPAAKVFVPWAAVFCERAERDHELQHHGHPQLALTPVEQDQLAARVMPIGNGDP
jgi:hypothetical protein